PIFRILEQNYLNIDPPDVHIAFFDIEADFDDETGYSDPADAFNKITSISVYLQWLEQMVCLAVPPDGMSLEEANKIAQEVGDTVIFETEEAMLAAFLDVIEDADI